MVSGRCDQDRRRALATEQRGRQVDGADVDEHTRRESPAAERPAIRAESHFGVGTGAKVAERVRGENATSRAFEVTHRD
jgi:hypothetical protein